MAELPYRGGVPGIEPAGAPPEDYQRIQANPRQFGAGLGQAEQEAGAQFEQTGLFYGQVAADDATNKWQQETDKLLYGTGQIGADGQPDRGFYGLAGEDAMRAMPVVQAKINSLRDQYRAGLPPVSALDFDQYTRRMQGYLNREIGAHYEGQFKTYGATVNKASGDLALNWIGNHAGDDQEVQHGIADLTAANVKAAQIMLGTNLPPEVLADAQSRAVRDGRFRQIEGLIPTNPGAAARILDENRDALSGDPRYDAVASRLRTGAAAAIGNEIFGAASGNAAAGVRAPTPAAPLPPDEYKPLISGAATQYNVPPELLTRVLSAENGFRPQGVSSAGARGIAQFLPDTAAKYNVNPDDPKSAIPGAAHYLADLHAQTGSWHAALTGYLGGDPKNDPSYTRAGAWQLADSLDKGGAQPSAPGGQNLEIWGDSLGVGLHTQLGAPGHVHGGDTPQTIFDQIKTQPADHWQGKTVVLPSGSNGDQMPVVEQTIAYLKQNGANVVAVGYGPKFPEKNAELATIAQRQGVPVVSAEGVGASEGVHPSPQGYAAMAQKIQALHPAGAATVVAPPNFDTQHAEGMVKPGNIDPWNRPVLHNPDGTYSTTSSISVGTGQGTEYLIPTVVDGKRLSNDDAIAHWRATGQNLGSFSSPEAADKYATALHNAQASMFDERGNPKAAAAPDQLVGQRQPAEALPSQPMPAGPPAPGVAEMASQRQALDQDYANTLAHIAADPRGADNPQAGAYAERRATADYNRKKTLLDGQMKAFTEQRNAMADSIVQRMIKNPSDPTILDDIQANPLLDASTRENLWRIYEAHNKNSVEGAKLAYGPGFFDAMNRMLLPNDDHQRISDPSQIYALAAPKPDGTQEITVVGAERLTTELRNLHSHVEAVGDAKIRMGALAYARKAITVELDTGIGRPIRLPEGEDRFNTGFLAAFFKYWDDGIAAHKTPGELASKDNLDKLMTPFMPSKAEQMQFVSTAAEKIGQAPPAPAGPPPLAVEALRGRPYLRAEFDLKYGPGAAEKILGAPPPAAPAAPDLRPPLR